MAEQTPKQSVTDKKSQLETHWIWEASSGGEYYEKLWESKNQCYLTHSFILYYMIILN